MKNIIYNTTRQWNCGDEFILLGTINLIKSVIGEHNAIIYNRNPDIRPANGSDVFFRTDKLPLDYDGKIYQKWGNKFRFGFNDNSIKFNSDLSYIDFAVFAGSPEWINDRCKNFYYHIIKNNIPTIIIGVGFAKKRVPAYIKEVLSKNLLFTVRDKNLLQYKIASDNNALYLPCPALFTVPLGEEKKIEDVKAIALNFQANYENSVRCQSLNDNTYNYCIKLYKRIIKKYKNLKVSIICHYIDDLETAYKEFGNENIDILYSYDSKDYIKIYKNFDLVISPRVHGSGISSSLGIPSFIIKHDDRGDTADGFLANEIFLNEEINKVFNKVDKLICNISNKNKELIEHKQTIFEMYKNVLIPALTTSNSPVYRQNLLKDPFGEKLEIEKFFKKRKIYKLKELFKIYTEKANKKTHLVVSVFNIKMKFKIKG